MIKFLKEIWRTDKKGFLNILLLNILSSFMGSIGIVMLIPMMSLLDISAGDNSWMEILMIPFAALEYSQKVLLLAVIYIILLLFQAVINRRVGIAKGRFMEQHGLNMRQKLYQAVGKADWESLAYLKRTDYVDMFTKQCGEFGHGVMQVIELMTSMVSAVMKLAIACLMSIPITLFVLFFGGIFLFLLYPYFRKSRKYGKEVIEINRSFFNELFNQLSSIKETRTYGIKKEDGERFNEVSQRFYRSHMDYIYMSSIPQMWYAVGAAVMVAVVFIFSLLVIHIQTAQLMVLVYVFAGLWPVFSSWQSRLQNIQASLPAYETVKETIEVLSVYCDEEMETGQSINYANNIEFKHVSFAYRNSGRSVLKDITFQLQYGTVTALAGKSGVGKSTLADLLLGLLKPTEGGIKVDGVLLTEENMAAWHGMVGYVPQEPLLLNASIRENLLRFHPNAKEAEMISALKRALAWEFVEKLEHGLDTEIGEQGVRLSGGERQRIVLARVLIGNPKLIVLDEATSALDYESEIALKETISALHGQTTVLIIAHRPATIQIADYAIVLENGSVIEQGELSALLQHKNGYLTRMREFI